MMDRYTLVGKNVVVCDDILKWADWFEKENRTVGRTYVGKVFISTVFLGIDHRWGTGPPILFETMIFGGEHDEYQVRYSTWEEAEEGHKNAVALVKGVV